MSLSLTTIQPIFAVNQFDETYLPSINRQTFEKVDSTSLFDKKFKSAFATQNHLHIIIGIDSGLLANYVMASTRAQDSHFIFIEMPEVLALLNCELDEQAKPYINIVTIEQFQELIHNEKYALYINQNRYDVHLSTACSNNHHEGYLTIRQALELTLENLRYELAQSSHLSDFMNTRLLNAADNRLPAKFLKQRFNGETAIILAGGPSLDEHLDWIKAHRQQLIVIAVSRISKRLGQIGITPDIIVCIDPYQNCYTVSAEMRQFAQHSILVNAYHVSPLVLGQWSGKSLYLGNRYEKELLPELKNNVMDEQDNLIVDGPTVTNSALLLAINMGFKQILFSGLDMCHSKQGFSHAKGSLEQAVGPNLGNIYRNLETYKGEMAEAPVYLYEACMNVQARIAQHPDIDFINLNINAAKVEGVKYQAMDSIKLCSKLDINVTEYLHHLVDSGYQLDHCAMLNEALTNTNKQLSQIVSIEQWAQQAFELAGQIQNLSETDPKRQKKLNQIEKLERKINRNKSFKHYIHSFGFRYFLPFLTTKDKQNWQQQDNDKRTKIYYEAYLKTCQQLTKLHRQSCQRIAQRLLELDPSTQLPQLIEQWQQDQQYLRFEYWLNWHQRERTSLSETEQLLLNELEQKADVLQQQRSETLTQRWHSENESLKVLGKLMHLVNHKNINGLKLLSQQLRHAVIQFPELNRLAYLSQSYMYQCLGDKQQALTCLQELATDQFTEPEYKLLVVLALDTGNLDIALNALQQLIQYSEQYTTQYAHLLKLAGQYQLSINTYLDYLDKHPTDTLTWLTLANLMLELKQLDTADYCFKKVLELDPNNVMANKYLTLCTQ